MDGSPVLNRTTCTKIFFFFGTQPEEKDKLYRYANGSVIRAADFFISLGLVLSISGDFQPFKLFINFNSPFYLWDQKTYYALHSYYNVIEKSHFWFYHFPRVTYQLFSSCRKVLVELITKSSVLVKILLLLASLDILRNMKPALPLKLQTSLKFCRNCFIEFFFCIKTSDNVTS
jgi:hypothetical protein